MFDNMWATTVAVKVANANGFSTDDLNEGQIRLLKLMALGLKDKGLSKRDAVDAFQKLVGKHGGLTEVLDFYSALFGGGIPNKDGGVDSIRPPIKFDPSSWDEVHESREIQRNEVAEMYPEPMRSWILNGGDVDDLPTGFGEFGGISNPIPVNGEMGEVKYLAKLRTKSGAPVCFHRTGSFESQATEAPVDEYEVISFDGAVRQNLYFDMYHPRRSCLAPGGYFLDRTEVGGMDVPWGYGVPEVVDNFPTGLFDALPRFYGEDLGRRLAKEFEAPLLNIIFKD